MRPGPVGYHVVGCHDTTPMRNPCRQHQAQLDHTHLEHHLHCCYCDNTDQGGLQRRRRLDNRRRFT